MLIVTMEAGPAKFEAPALVNVIVNLAMARIKLKSLHSYNNNIITFYCCCFGVFYLFISYLNFFLVLVSPVSFIHIYFPVWIVVL